MKDDSPFQHVLYQDDLSGLSVGPLQSNPHFTAIARGLGKYLVSEMPPPASPPRLHTFGDEAWGDYRFRAVVTPLSFEKCPPMGGFCGIVARYQNACDYIALVLARDGHLKLLRRTPAGFTLLATAPLVFCMGQSLSLTLAVVQGEVVGVAGPYAGATVIKAALPAGSIGSSGKAGFISSAQTRFGPHTVECTPEESTRIDTVKAQSTAVLEKKRVAFPKMKLDRTVPLNGPASMWDIRVADINGDGKLEILAGHSSAKIAEQISLTRLTALTAYNFDGKILWQAGAPESDWSAPPKPVTATAPANLNEEGRDGTLTDGKLPFRVHDLYGDGHPVVVCVFGYDLQIRDGKTGRVTMSGTTPSTVPVSDEFKNVAQETSLGKWGDETLNMDVAQIDFCDTQGSGGKREIAVRDRFHNLAVLDPLSEPFLQSLFTHRGNLGGELWAGDLDGDGKDELIAGCSLLDDDGRAIATLVLNGEPQSARILDPLNESGCEKRLYLCAENAGILALDVDSLLANGRRGELPANTRAGSSAPRKLIAAKLRADLPGLQFVAAGESEFNRVTLFDSSLNEIWSREFAPSRGEIEAVNWTGKPESLIWISTTEVSGLMDGNGDIVVQAPAGFDYGIRASILKKYCPDGRDAIAAWSQRELSIFVPDA